MKSLNALQHRLASPEAQLVILEQQKTMPAFSEKLQASGLYPLTPTKMDI
ncbi:MAG: hypothetical protein JNM68_00255 [Dinghuibacter sp.]|nr:hypothetical protein [Dinghuibacter sp.]